MSQLIIWTYDWVPEGPRGFVRDLRLRWACEEAALAYSVRTVPFDGSRLDQIEQVLNRREWLAADRFTVADLLMADVLRVSKVRAFGDRPATENYVTRVTDRPSFKKARADQLAHFAAADENRS